MALKSLVYNHSTKRSFIIDKEKTIIGRTEGDLKFPNDNLMSGKHCEIRRIGWTYYLVDLGSKNGVLVSGIKVDKNKKVLLKDEDFLEIGSQQFTFKKNMNEELIAQMSDVDYKEKTIVFTPKGPLENSQIHKKSSSNHSTNSSPSSRSLEEIDYLITDNLQFQKLLGQQCHIFQGKLEKMEKDFTTLLRHLEGDVDWEELFIKDMESIKLFVTKVTRGNKKILEDLEQLKKSLEDLKHLKQE